MAEAGNDAGPSNPEAAGRVPARVLKVGVALVDLAVRSDSGPDREKARK